jgi:hypothetical protein
MGTPKQIEAARRNGAKSKGPVTAEGKAKSSKNAMKHGLAADPDMLLATEHDDNYDRLLQAYMETYQPANGAEYDLVCQIVTASWKLRRIGRIEAQILGAEIEFRSQFLDEDAPENADAGLEGKAFRALSSGRSIDLLLRYAAAARRAYDIALKTLRDVQRERRKAELQNEPDFAEPHKGSTTYKTPRGTLVAFVPKQSATNPVETNVQDEPAPPDADDGSPSSIGIDPARVVK